MRAKAPEAWVNTPGDDVFADLATVRAVCGLTKEEVGELIQGGLLLAAQSVGGGPDKWLVSLGGVARFLRARSAGAGRRRRCGASHRNPEAGCWK
jgi:hypothetical protein